jgi:hypothetical protein
MNGRRFEGNATDNEKKNLKRTDVKFEQAEQLFIKQRGLNHGIAGSYDLMQMHIS